MLFKRFRPCKRELFWWKIALTDFSVLWLFLRPFSASSKSQVETIDEEVFKETDLTESCHGDNNDPEPENVPSEADTPSELNENAITFAAMRSMSASIGSWRSGTSSSSWGAVCDNFPQLRLLLGFLKVNTNLR